MTRTGARRTAGVESVFFVPLGHDEIEMRTLVGQDVGESFERVGAFLRDHVQEERHAVSTSWVREDRLFLVSGEVASSTQ